MQPSKPPPADKVHNESAEPKPANEHRGEDEFPKAFSKNVTRQAQGRGQSPMTTGEREGLENRGGSICDKQPTKTFLFGYCKSRWGLSDLRIFLLGVGISNVT